jgi:hypothetical protein
LPEVDAHLGKFRWDAFCEDNILVSLKRRFLVLIRREEFRQKVVNESF